MDEKTAPTSGYKLSTADLSKVSFAALVGGLIETYDVSVAGPASVLAWPRIFFPIVNPTIALILSLTPFIITFVARPFGALLFGHFGDRLGRKDMLVWTMILVGVGTLIIILVPGYDRIGLAAPIILSVGRVLIGLGLGGEWGTAMSWVIENAADRKRRGFWTALSISGYPLGGLFTGLSISLILARVGLPAFVSFWWRLPFIISLVIVVIGAIIRLKLFESRIFQEILKNKQVRPRPSFEVLRKMPKTVLRLALIPPVTGATFFFASSIIVRYMEQIAHIPASFATNTITYGEIVAVVVVIFLIGSTIDTFGRRNMALLVAGLAAVISIPYAYLMMTGVKTFVLAAQILLLGSAIPMVGVMSSLSTESFPPEYRVSGSGLVYQIGTLIGTLPTFFGAYLLKFGTISILYISFVLLTYYVIGFISAYFTKETKGVSLEKTST